MKIDETKRLIEHIGDQYLTLAADPVDAFEAIRERKARGRTRLWTVTATAAAVVIFTIVFLLSGVMNGITNPPIVPPDNTITPGGQPDDGTPGNRPGDSETPPADDPDHPDEPGLPPQDDLSYPEPQITLPDPLLFTQHLDSYWTTDWGLERGEINYIFNFQLDGRVYIINLDTQTGEIGRYSLIDDTIELWTLAEGVGWEKSDISIRVIFGEHGHNTQMLVSKNKKATTYIRMVIDDEHLEMWNTNVEPSEGKAVYPYYVGQASLFDYSEITFDLPEVEYFEQLEVFQFTHFPDHLRFSSVPSAQYKIYDEDFELIIEADCITMKSFGECELVVPEEDGLYYLEVIANPAGRTSFHSAIFEQLAVHYYAAIRVGEPEEPVTPPDEPIEPTAPELSLPSINLFFSHLSAAWGDSGESSNLSTPYMFVFQPDGRLYIFNHLTGETITGLYALEDVEALEAFMNSGELTHQSDADVWLQDESGEWYLSDIEITFSFHAKDDLCYLDYTIGAVSGQAHRGDIEFQPRLAFYSGDGTIRTERRGLYNFYYEEIELLGSNAPLVRSFELPVIEKGSSFVKALADSACIFTRMPNAGHVTATWEHGGYYKLYDSECRLIAEGDCDLTPNTANSGFEVPDDGGLYYIDICVEDYYNPTPNLLSKHKIHYYVAFQVKNSISADPYQPPKGTTARVEIFDCDTLPSASGNFTLDRTNKTEGGASLSLEVDQKTITVLHHTFDPIRATGCDVLEFDMYVSDAKLFENTALLSKYFTIELSSGGQVDVAEINFYGKDIIEKGLAGQTLKSGWNHVAIRLRDGEAFSVTNEAFDVNAIDLLRIYLIDNSTLPEGEHIIKFDNIYLSKEVK